MQILSHQTRQLVLANGQSYPQGRLLIATGAAARPLPQLDRLGDRCLTSCYAGSAERLRDSLLPGKSIVIVGTGTIGPEPAASVAQRDCQVTVVELALTIVGRNAPALVRDYLLARHQLADVRVLLNSAIKHTEAREYLPLMLQNGETLTADVVTYGISIMANDMLAREAGPETANGIIVDAVCIISNPAIFTAGDVAVTRQADSSLVHMESWENANFQAQAIIATMLSQPQPIATPGWFWTNQYRDNLQFVGEMQGENWFLRGDSDAQKAIWFNLWNSVIVGAVMLDQGRRMCPLRKWIQAGEKSPVAALINETISFKSI